VAESTPGNITRIDARTGAKRVLVSKALNVAGVGQQGGKIYAAIGGANETGQAPPGRFPGTSVVRFDANGRNAKVLANLEKYELAHNPDRQVQFVNGKPVEALSNPFSLNVSRYGLLVADGGANAILRVGRETGKVATFFVPPVIKSPACLKVRNNPGTRGCDSVPTGVTVARGNVYVATLGSDVPGAARVYQLNPGNGRVERTWKGLTGLTGIAVSPDGTIFVSQVFHGAPAMDGPPPAGFDPSSVGRITKIAPSGKVTHAQVTMPTGLDYRSGSLYASTWSTAGFMGIKKAGKVVRVPQSSFR
jgi:hypothetical protein